MNEQNKKQQSSGLISLEKNPDKTSTQNSLQNSTGIRHGKAGLTGQALYNQARQAAKDAAGLLTQRHRSIIADTGPMMPTRGAISSEQFKTYAIIGQEEQQGINEYQRFLENMLMPAPGKNVVGRVTQFLTLMPYMLTSDENKNRLTIDGWCGALDDLPDWSLKYVFDEFIRNKTDDKKPKPGEVREKALLAITFVQMRLHRLRQFLQVSVYYPDEQHYQEKYRAFLDLKKAQSEEAVKKAQEWAESDDPYKKTLARLLLNNAE